MPQAIIHIPVSEAQRVATLYAKSLVVIIAADAHHIYTSTFGVSPADKVAAAILGDFLAAQMGLAPNAADFSEDFRRDFDAANYKTARDLLKSALAVLNAHAIGHQTQTAIETFLESIKTPTSPSV